MDPQDQRQDHHPPAVARRARRIPAPVRQPEETPRPARRTPGPHPADHRGRRHHRALTPAEPEHPPPDSVGSARLTCGRHPSQTPPAQVSPKREDLTWENTILIMVLVDRLVDRLSG